MLTLEASLPGTRGAASTAPLQPRKEAAAGASAPLCPVSTKMALGELSFKPSPASAPTRLHLLTHPLALGCAVPVPAARRRGLSTQPLPLQAGRAVQDLHPIFTAFPERVASFHLARCTAWRMGAYICKCGDREQ